ncbi:hypothetical protein [Streptomyces sp. NBC_01443]|uniref:hypothetical protein n=1 Tax=Streptomyces sp. NBC_01443 TaxID=2903868 RepID=UPI0022518E81|nr:hypothetical protein [Streptomyces sp. NBC_01443]MCX4632969.1 DUF4132 domain-containing protein [Streptomyces sp. NBC_01443]
MNDLVTDLFDPGNGWSTRTRERFTGLSPELGELVVHLGTSDGFWNWRYKVDAAWKRRAKALLKADGADELVRYAVRELARGGSFHVMDDPEHVIRELGMIKPASRARSLAIGFLLAAGWLRRDIEGLSADLAAVARKNAQAMDTYHRVDDDIAGAAFAALGDLPGPEVMEELWALHYDVARALHPQKVLVKSVKKAAARLGVPAHELAERTVPRHGLERDGTLTVGWFGKGVLWWNASVDAVVTLHDTRQVTVDWADGDHVTRTTAPFRSPAGYKTPMRADSVTLVRRYAQNVGKTLAEEQRRLGALAGGTRTWLWADWVRYYRDHPITGVATRALAWEYRLPNGTAYRTLHPDFYAVPAAGVPAATEVRRRPDEGAVSESAAG